MLNCQPRRRATMEIIVELSNHLGFNFPHIVAVFRAAAMCTVEACEANSHFNNSLSRTSLSQRAPRHDLVITAIISQKSFGPINSKRFYSGYFVLVSTKGRHQSPHLFRPFRIIALFIVPNQSTHISIYTNHEFLVPFFISPLTQLLFSFAAMFASL